MMSTTRVSSGVTSPWRAPRAGASAGFLSPDRANLDDPARSTPRRKPGQTTTSPNGCRVLVIEDDPAAANALRVILTMRGCEVALAASLEQALDLLNTNPTIIVMDLMLPDGDGIEVLTRVREAHLSIRVAVTTAVRDPARLAAVHRLKPDCILHKPVDLGELLRAIGVA